MKKLQGIMKNIHDDLLSAAKEYGKTKDVVDYMTGANVAGFFKGCQCVSRLWHFVIDYLIIDYFIIADQKNNLCQYRLFLF